MAFALALDGTDLRSTKTQRDILECEDTIFTWDSAGAYAYYLLDLPGIDLNLIGNNVGDVEQIQRNGKQWRPYESVLHPSAVIRLSVPATMQPLPPRYRLCVTLDSLGVTVPAAIANIVSASFLVGMVTRLMLKRCGDRTTANFINELNSIARAPQDFVQGYGADVPSFQARFQVVAQNNSVQPSGLFLGWNAGGDAAVAGDEVVNAIWRLLHIRFGWQEIGELTAYGLSYCLGFMHVQAVFRARNTSRDQGQVAAPDQILAKMKDDANISSLEATIVQFFNALLGSFVVATKTSANTRAVSNYSEFLRGYQRGSIRGATTIFDATLKVGYGLGYEDGFRVGYARGYSDGYRAGYKDGQDTDWGQVLHDIATVVSNVATVIEVFA